MSVCSKSRGMCEGGNLLVFFRLASCVSRGCGFPVRFRLQPACRFPINRPRLRILRLPAAVSIHSNLSNFNLHRAEIYAEPKHTFDPLLIPLPFPLPNPQVDARIQPTP